MIRRDAHCSSRRYPWPVCCRWDKGRCCPAKPFSQIQRYSILPYRFPEIQIYSKLSIDLLKLLTTIIYRIAVLPYTWSASAHHSQKCMCAQGRRTCSAPLSKHKGHSSEGGVCVPIERVRGWDWNDDGITLRNGCHIEELVISFSVRGILNDEKDSSIKQPYF